MTQQLYQLIPLIINLLDNGTESLKSVLKILALMIQLAPENIFQGYGNILISKLSILLGSLIPEASKHILNLLDTCIQVLNPPSMLLLSEISSSGILKKMIIETIKGEELHVIIMDYNLILSRIILINPQIFLGEINSLENSNQLLSSFIDELISRVTFIF